MKETWLLKTMDLHFIPPLILQKLIWLPTRLVLVLFLRLRVVGLQNLKGLKGPVIFACNHTSEIDPFLTPASLPFFSRFSPLFSTTKDKSFYSRSGWRKHLFGGWFINMWGGYTVPSGLHDYEKSLAVHVGILRHGESFCVFPEGGINPEGTAKPAHGGVAYMAEKGGCPVVPVAISGIYGVSYKQFLKNIFARKFQVVVRFGQPIFPAELESQDFGPIPEDSNIYKQRAEYVMGKVRGMM